MLELWIAWASNDPVEERPFPDLQGPCNHSEEKMEMLLLGIVCYQRITYPSLPDPDGHYSTLGGIPKSLLTSLRSELHKKYR